MTKLSLSHALAQSVKISLFESLISSTIEDTRDLPETISSFGLPGTTNYFTNLGFGSSKKQNQNDTPAWGREAKKARGMEVTHKEVMRQIGGLFVLRMEINSVGSVVDSPEVFWVRSNLCKEVLGC
jgi:uncharacterized Rmd1/YagE family protein